MSEFSITINAINIFDRLFRIPDKNILNPKTGSLEPMQWVDATTKQSVLLGPGTHILAVPSCNSSVKFTITDDGKVEYDEKLSACLSGKGTSTLTVKGLPVTIDARYVGMGGAFGVLLGAGGLTDDDWIVHKSIFLLPGANYVVEQGSATVSSFIFSLNPEGHFDYDPGDTNKYDLSLGGFLGGRGTSTLVFRGYPFLIDATQVGEQVYFFNVNGTTGANNAVSFANLLPMQVYFCVGFAGGPIKEPAAPTHRLGFKVHLDGTTDLGDGHFSKLAQDTFHGLTRLTIVKKQ